MGCADPSAVRQDYGGHFPSGPGGLVGEAERVANGHFQSRVRKLWARWERQRSSPGLQVALRTLDTGLGQCPGVLVADRKVLCC